MHRNEKKYELGEMATDSKLIKKFDKLVTTDTRLSIFSKKNSPRNFYLSGSQFLSRSSLTTLAT